MKKQVFTLIIVVFIFAIANGVSAQQTPMHGWTEVTAVQGSITVPISREDVLTNQDGSWTVLWLTSPTSGFPFTLRFKEFDQNNQPGTEGEITQIGEARYPILNDQEGNIYVVLTDISAYPSYILKLTKIDRSGAIVFQIAIDNLGGNTGGSYPQFALGSDNQFSIIYYLSPGWRFARANRDGIITTQPRSIQLNLFGTRLTSDRQGNLYIFGQDATYNGRPAYQKLNERDGSPIGNPVVMGTSAAVPYDFAYRNDKLHFVWREDVGSVNNVYYSQYDAATNQPVVARQLLWSTQSQDRIFYEASLAVTDDGSRINVIIFDRDNQVTRMYHRIYFMQIDNTGRVTIPQTLMADMSIGSRPLTIGKIAQIYETPYIIFGDRFDLASPDKIIAKIYDPQIIGPENPYTESCNVYQINAPLQNSQNYIVAASLGTSPGTPLPGGRTLPLNPDSLLFLSLTGNLIRNNLGVLDSSGRTTFRIRLPQGLPNNLQFYLAFLTFGQQVGFISKPKLQQIQTQC